MQKRLVCAHIDWEVKEIVDSILRSLGLSESEGIQLFYEKVAKDSRLPLIPLGVNVSITI